MSKFWRQIFIILLFRLDWRKVFFVGAIITIAGVLFQISSLPYPFLLTLSPSVPVLTYEPLDRTTTLSEITAPRHKDNFDAARVGPRIILLNTAAELNQSRSVVDVGTKFPRTSGRIKESKLKVLVTPPLPPPVKTVSHHSLVRLLSF